MTTTRYTVLTGTDVQLETQNLQVAIRCWDAVTFATDAPTEGGISVQSWDAAGNMTRDGWILHVRENGVVYLNPNLAAA